MPVSHDREYYAARAAKARASAEQASDPEIAAIHRRMVASYEELAALMPAGAPKLQIVGD